MKKLLIALIIILMMGFVTHADHDDIRTITPVVHEGWNLLGFSLQPYVMNDSIISSGYDAIMYAALENRVFYFDDGYVVADTFRIGEGFWMKSNVTAPLIQQGIASPKRVHLLSKGWNIISPLEKEIHPLLLLYSHQTIDSIWAWDHSDYQYEDMLASKEHLMPGYGYWIHTTQSDTLFYDGFSSHLPPQAPTKLVVVTSQRRPPKPPVYVEDNTWGKIKRKEDKK